MGAWRSSKNRFIYCGGNLEQLPLHVVAHAQLFYAVQYAARPDGCPPLPLEPRPSTSTITPVLQASRDSLFIPPVPQAED